VRYERRRQRRSSVVEECFRVCIHTTAATLGTPPPGGGCSAAAAVPLSLTGQPAQVYTHATRPSDSPFFPSRRCRYCCAPPHRHNHRPPPITLPPSAAASVRFLHPHCRWYLSDRTIMTRTTPVTTEDRFRCGGDGPRCCQASRSAPSLLLFCFVIFLSVNHETIVTEYIFGRHAKPPNS